MGEQGWTCSRWHLSSFLRCFSLQGLALLTVSWQWNVNHWYWTNLKAPCETCPYVPRFDIIYLEWSCSLLWNSYGFHASVVATEESSWSSPEISEKYHLLTEAKRESGTSPKVNVSLAILYQACVICTMLAIPLCLVICKSWCITLSVMFTSDVKV